MSLATKPRMPVAADLAVFLSGAGLRSESGEPLEEVLDLEEPTTNALDAFEEATGFRPFMATGTPTERRFTPDAARTVDLDGGIPSRDLVVTVGAQGTSPGTVQTLDADFFLMEPRALDQYRPFTYLRFRGRLYGLQDSIRIVTDWGFCQNGQVPQRAFDTVLRGAALLVMPTVTAAITRGLVMIKEGDVEERYSDKGAFTVERGIWEEQYDAAVMAYSRPTIP